MPVSPRRSATARRPTVWPGRSPWRRALPTVVAVAVGLLAVAGAAGRLEAIPRQPPPATSPPQTSDSVLAAQLAADPSRPLPLDPRVRTGTLPNGLRYYVRPNAQPARRAELRLVVGVGSIAEDDDQRGLAHVLEHMAFNGTRRFAKQEIVQFIERAGMRFGADLNAGTGFDETVYHLQLPTDTGSYLPRALDWFADIAGGGITLDPAELVRERAVVVEEWRLGRGAGERIQQQHFPVLFRGSRYATRFPIGTRESLESFTHAQLARFYRDWYRPDLMAVIAVGDFDADSMVALVQERLGGVPAATPEARARVANAVPRHAESLVAVATDPEATESNVAIVWKQPPSARATVADFRRRLVRELFVEMLNERFAEMLRRPDAPFVDAGAGHGRLVRATDAFWLSATVEDGRIERGLNAVLAEVERARRFGFTPAEFARQRTELLRSLDAELAEAEHTTSQVFALRYAEHFLSADVPIAAALRAALARALLPSITLDETGDLVRLWLVEEDRVVLAASPARSGILVPAASALRAALTRARTAELQPYRDGDVATALVPNPPAPGRVVSERTIAPLGVTEWTLSNGIRVLIKPTDFQGDEVLIHGVSLGGVGGQSAERYYSARLGPLLLERGGLGTVDASALARFLSGKRAAISAEVDDRTESVGGQASAQDLWTAFELIWARTQLPRLDTAAIAAVKQQYSAMLRSRANDPAAAYNDTIGVTMSQGHPHAKPVTDSILQTLNAGVALEVFRDRFSDFSDFTFFVVGAVDPIALRPVVEQWIAPLPAGGRRETPRDPGIRPPPGRIARTMRAGTEPRAQTAIIITGETQWTRDAALEASAISDILNVRMRELLREDLGGTYGVGFGTGIERWPVGRFTTSISFGAAPERIDSLAAVALNVLRRFAAEGPTEAELETVRTALLRDHETALRQNDFWMGLLQAEALWGDSAEETLATHTERVRALTPERLKARAAVVFDDRNLARFTLYPEAAGRDQEPHHR